MLHLRRALPFLIIVGIYTVSVLLVDPRGEFPLNDDWSYSRSAFFLGTGSRLHVDEWSAMSLIGQAIYGGALVKILGPSFLLLRLSTLVLSCGMSILLWALLRRLTVRPSLTWIAVLSWIFNPIQFCLSFTFMTEIPFLFFMALALFLYTRYLQSRSLGLLTAWSAVLGYGFLIRQTAVFFAGPLMLTLLIERNREWRERIGRTALAFAAFVPFVTGYYAWLLHHGGATPAARRKFELLRYLTMEQIVGNSLGTFFYLSFILLPLLIPLIPHLLRIGRGFKPRIVVSCLAPCIGVAVFGLCWFHVRYTRPQYLPSDAYHAQMPLLLNVLYDSGLGPVTLDPTYYGPPATPVYPKVWLCITVAVAMGVVILGSICMLGIARFRSEDRVKQWSPLLLATGLAALGVAAFETVFSHLQEGGLFDRHLLISALPVCILLGLIHCGTQEQRPDAGNSRLGVLPAMLLIVSAWFSVTATHDYLAWNRVRWDLATSLLEQKVDPLSLSAGFEFNAWHNYDVFRNRGNVGKVYYWWYDKRDYLISMRPEPGYRILRQEEYFSWLHRRSIPLYALRKQDD
ncbi:MAG TPA: glycosyltransferase family 39 protein [Acidobacteriota bacterium]|nr:glycosyltransferase family 39 protein [Acidobacteriota bacterium]